MPRSVRTDGSQAETARSKPHASAAAASRTANEHAAAGIRRARSTATKEVTTSETITAVDIHRAADTETAAASDGTIAATSSARPAVRSGTGESHGDRRDLWLTL